MLNSRFKCVPSSGDTIRFAELSPVIVLNVTFNLKSGRTVTKRIDLKKIGKSQLLWLLIIVRDTLFYFLVPL